MQPLASHEIAARLARHGIDISTGEAESLADFLNLLEQWNRVHNLTGIRDRAELIDRHLVESLALEAFLGPGDVADIGSGGGLPGLPLAIRRPGTSFTLIESRRKRVSFLRHAAARLGLRNVGVAHGRAEALDLPCFAAVLARAVAPPAELLAIASPLVAPGGRLVLLTGSDKGRAIVDLAPGYRALDTGTANQGLKSRIVVLERALS
jgi:16S rRNA (guanine527-N7)-methyltransferase